MILSILQGQESILGQGTLDQRPLPGSSGQRQKSQRSEKLLEWLFIFEEQQNITRSWAISTPNPLSSPSWNKEKCGWCRPKFQVKAVQTKSGKLMTI